uniref:Glycoprotein hormone subunit alpha 2 n=1 Tax=Sparus aurata TaxID=8175 RepID=A0A671TLF4_SPAAU
MSPCMTSHCCLLVLPVMSLLLLFSPFSWSYEGLTPGCHLHPFNVTIRSDRRGTCKGTHLVYACVGYCESSAFPSRYSVLVASNFTHNITSASRCCTISKDAKVRWRRCSSNSLECLLVSARCSCPLTRPPSGQSASGLPSRSTPRRNRDPDGEGVSLRHVPQVPLLTRQDPPRTNEHRDKNQTTV